MPFKIMNSRNNVIAVPCSSLEPYGWPWFCVNTRISCGLHHSHLWLLGLSCSAGSTLAFCGQETSA